MFLLADLTLHLQWKETVNDVGKTGKIILLTGVTFPKLHKKSDLSYFSKNIYNY